jgi:hypothetical protein
VFGLKVAHFYKEGHKEGEYEGCNAIESFLSRGLRKAQRAVEVHLGVQSQGCPEGIGSSPWCLVLRLPRGGSLLRTMKGALVYHA